MRPIDATPRPATFRLPQMARRAVRNIDASPSRIGYPLRPLQRFLPAEIPPFLYCEVKRCSAVTVEMN